MRAQEVTQPGCGMIWRRAERTVIPVDHAVHENQDLRTAPGGIAYGGRAAHGLSPSTGIETLTHG